MFFSWIRIQSWMMNGVYGSIAVFFLTVGAFHPQAFRDDGKVAGFETLGATMYTTIIWVVNIQIALATSHFTWIQHLVIWGSILIWYIFLMVYGIITPLISSNAFLILSEALAPSPFHWLSVLAIGTGCILPYLALSAFQRRFRPMDHHIIQEIKYLNKDKLDPEMWLKEREKAVERADFGFTAMVRQIKRKLRKPPSSHTLDKRDHHHVEIL